jgi:hypothetical protein
MTRSSIWACFGGLMLGSCLNTAWHQEMIPTIVLGLLTLFCTVGYGDARAEERRLTL